jgi:hypothetical protein
MRDDRLSEGTQDHGTRTKGYLAVTLHGSPSMPSAAPNKHENTKSIRQRMKEKKRKRGSLELVGVKMENGQLQLLA